MVSNCAPRFRWSKVLAVREFGQPVSMGLRRTRVGHERGESAVAGAASVAPDWGMDRGTRTRNDAEEAGQTEADMWMFQLSLALAGAGDYIAICASQDRVASLEYDHTGYFVAIASSSSAARASAEESAKERSGPDAKNRYHKCRTSSASQSHYVVVQSRGDHGRIHYGFGFGSSSSAAEADARKEAQLLNVPGRRYDMTVTSRVQWIQVN